MKNRFPVRFPIFLSQGRILPDCKASLFILLKKKLLHWKYESPGIPSLKKKRKSKAQDRNSSILLELTVCSLMK